MASDSYVVGYDAGFVHLGFAVARLPEKPTDKPVLVDLGVSTASLPSKKVRKRKGIPAVLQNILRIRKQTATVIAIHEKFDPRAYFVEFPTGGAKSATAMRSMAYATAIPVCTLQALAPTTPLIAFLPGDVKEALTDNFSASKEEVARKVMDYWPGVKNWPGFELDKHGKKKISHDSTDAGAVVLAAMQHEMYRILFAK